MEKSTILRFLSLILSPVILLDDKAFICKKEIGKTYLFFIGAPSGWTSPLKRGRWQPKRLTEGGRYRQGANLGSSPL
jgi:hypothetical protein